MGWYYVITQEMRESFEGKEVDVFAVINGFSQDGQGCFYGSLAALSEFCGIKSKTTTQNVLKSLIQKGAITKQEELVKGVKVCSYSVAKNWYGIPKINMGGMSKIDTNNKDIDNKYNTLSNNKGAAKFSKPSVDEVAAYCIERGNKVNAESFCAFYESNGWKVGRNPMKDWKAAVRTWEGREKAEAKKATAAPRQQPRKMSAFELNCLQSDRMFGTHMHEQYYGKKKEDTDEQ